MRQSPAGTNVAFFSLNLFLNFSKSENPQFCKCGDDTHSGRNYSCYRIHWLSVVSGTQPGISAWALSLNANERNHLTQNKRNPLGWYQRSKRIGRRARMALWNKRRLLFIPHLGPKFDPLDHLEPTWWMEKTNFASWPLTCIYTKTNENLHMHNKDIDK